MSKNYITPTKVITGLNTRWSYANVWEAKSINGGTPKFSVSLIIPKDDTVTVKLKRLFNLLMRRVNLSLREVAKPCLLFPYLRHRFVTAILNDLMMKPMQGATSSMPTVHLLRAS